MMISSLPLAFSTIIIIFNAFDGRTIDKLLPARRLFPNNIGLEKIMNEKMSKRRIQIKDLQKQ